MKKQVCILIFGIVQGVFFRVSAAGVARKLNLTGFIRNLPDRNVEVIIEGEEALLQKMIDWCHKGPPGSRVTHVETKWSEATSRFTQFQIR